MSQKRVLLITDDNRSFEPLYELLVEQGYELRVSNTDSQVLQIVSEFAPQTILLDWPNLEVSEKFASLEQALNANRHRALENHIPVVYLFDRGIVENWQEKRVLHINFGPNRWAIRSDERWVLGEVGRSISLYHQLRNSFQTHTTTAPTVSGTPT